MQLPFKPHIAVQGVLLWSAGVKMPGLDTVGPMAEMMNWLLETEAHPVSPLVGQTMGLFALDYAIPTAVSKALVVYQH